MWMKCLNLARKSYQLFYSGQLNVALLQIGGTEALDLSSRGDEVCLHCLAMSHVNSALSFRLKEYGRENGKTAKQSGVDVRHHALCGGVESLVEYALKRSMFGLMLARLDEFESLTPLMITPGLVDEANAQQLRMAGSTPQSPPPPRRTPTGKTLIVPLSSNRGLCNEISFISPFVLLHYGNQYLPFM